MDISPTTLQLLINPSSVPSRASAPLQIGQLLNVLVLDTPAKNTATIAVAGQKLTALTQTQLLPGQRLTARVESDGSQPVLRVVPNPAEGSAKTLNQALRNALPHQVPINQGLQAILHHAKPIKESLPGPVRHAVAQLSEAIANPTSLRDAKIFAGALRDSGIFLEAHLKQLAGQPRSLVDPSKDTKARLLRLVDVLGKALAARAAPPPNRATDQSPKSSGTPFGDTTTLQNFSARETIARSRAYESLPFGEREAKSQAADASARSRSAAETTEVLKQLLMSAKASLANVQTHQLQTVKSADGPQQAWELEIPVWIDQEVRALELRIRRESVHSNARDEYLWAVDVSIDLGERGPLHVRVAWRNGQVGAIFWAEQKATSELVSQRLETLRSDLEDVGLDVNQLTCHHGRAPVAKQHFEQMIAVRA